MVGEEKQEPEIDLSSFLERQRLSETPSAVLVPARQVDEDEIDNTIAPILPHLSSATPNTKKGQVHQVEWDEQLEQMSREKTTADAARGEEKT